MKFHKFAVITLLMLVLAWAPSGYAQSDRGGITGTVSDPTGAVVANAKVTVTNVETNEVRETIANDNGNFNIPQLQAATYRLTVEAPGFKTVTINDVKVDVQITRNADIKLEIGEVGEIVTISSDDTSVLQTDSPAQQLNVSERQVRELPLLVAAESGGRSPLSFIFLDSSIVSQGSGSGVGQTSGSTGTNATNFRVNGGQGLGTDILIDGAATRRAENGTFFSEVGPGPNAFQEFTISTSNYSAEFGNSSGGVVNFTIKSGSNDFHGEAYAFFINEALNSNIDRNRILNSESRCRERGIACLEKPLDRQRDFGFSIGGPVYLPRFGEGGPSLWSGKNRTFFFFNYGGYRTSQAESVDITVPTVRMRNGDFGELLTDPKVLQFFGGPVQIFDPSQDPGERTAIPGNRLDLYLGGARIDPAGRNFVNLFPLPNQTGPNGSSVFRNYRASSVATAESNYYVTKINQAISNSQQLAFSYTFRKLPSDKGGFPRFPQPFIAQGRWLQEFKSYYARLQHDYTFGPTLLNHFNAGFSRSDVQNRNASRNLGSPAQLGLPANATQNLALPLIGFPGYGDDVTSDDPRSYQAGGSTPFDNRVRDNAVQLSDFVTYSRGRHMFKFGAEVRTQQLNNNAKFDLGGNFNFRSNQTGNTNDFNQGWPIASLLTGRPEFSFQGIQAVDPGYRFFNSSYFVQDDVKFTPRLTLNIGVRYDLPRPRYEANDAYRGFDPDAPNPAAGSRLGALAGAAGQGGVQAVNRGLVKPDYSNFGPRFGFAYSIDDRTVVRGGYGLYYAPILYNDFGNDGGPGYNTTVLNINGGLDANITLSNYPALPNVNPNDQFIGGDVNYFNKDYKTGRTAQYSLDLQRELPANFALSISYIGNRGTRLRSNFSPLNALPTNALKLGDALLRTPLNEVTLLQRAYAQSVGVTLPDAVFPGFNGNVAQSLKRFPQYNRINSRLEGEGQSSYNALKAELQRRFSNGVQLGVSYTFSKLITDAGEDLFGDSPLNGVLQNPFDRKSLRTVSPNSIPHSLVFNYIAELPFGKGKRFLNHGGLIDRLVGGFQISGILRYRSGPGLVPFVAGGARDFLDLVGYGGNLRPNVTGQPFYTDNPSGGVVYRYLNLAAFARPTDYRGAPAFSLDGTTVNPAYAAYYANPSVFFGNAAPTYSHLRAQPFYTEDLSILKKTRITETTYFEIRAEFFNLLNRGRYGFPELNLDNPGNFGNSGRNGDIFQPRRIQVGGRFVF